MRTRCSSTGSGSMQPYIEISWRLTSMAATTLRPNVLVRAQHLGQQRHRRMDQVIAQQHGERLVADVRLRHRHGVAQAERLLLPDGVDLGHLRDLPDRLELLELAFRFEELLELDAPVEMVLDGLLSAAGHDQDVLDPGAHGLLHDQLDRGGVDDRQHRLRLRLRGGQEARAEAGRRDDALAHLHVPSGSHGTRTIRIDTDARQPSAYLGRAGHGARRTTDTRSGAGSAGGAR